MRSEVRRERKKRSLTWEGGGRIKAVGVFVGK